MGVHHHRLACTRMSSGTETTTSTNSNQVLALAAMQANCHRGPALAAVLGTNPTASHASAQRCAAMHVCCCNQVCSHSLLRTSALLCCALSPAHEMYAGCLGVRQHEDALPAPEALRARLCGCRLIERGRPDMYGCGLRATNALAA